MEEPISNEGPHDNTDFVRGVQPTPVRRKWIRGALLSGAVALFLITGWASLAAFFARNAWWCELLCHFRVQYFWALVASTITFAALRHWLLASGATFLATLNLALIAPLYFGPPEETVEGAPLRVLSLNLHFTNHDFDAVRELVGQEKPDVIFLMEFTPAWADALRELEKDYPHTHQIPSHTPSGVAMFSRHEIADLEIHELKDIGLPTLIAGIETPRGRMTLIGTHPASPGSAEHFDARNRQLAEVADLASKRSGPVALVGDLNTTGWSPYFEDLLRVSGLRDSRLGYGVEPTWPGFPLPLRIPLDHCLVSPDITVVNRRVGQAVGSDHRPLLVDIAF